jgi:hypothetical protein
VGRMGDRRAVHRVLVDRPHGKRPVGRPRRRWEDLREVRWRGMDWIDLAQDTDTWQKLRNAVKSLQTP